MKKRLVVLFTLMLMSFSAICQVDATKFQKMTADQLQEVKSKATTAYLPTLNMMITTQAENLKIAQEIYKDDYNVTVGYGMLPSIFGYENIWSYLGRLDAVTNSVAFNTIPKMVSKYVFQPQIKDRAAQTNLYNLSYTLFKTSFESLSAKNQLLVLFPLYKAQQYLKTLNWAKELKRAEQKNFTLTDWNNRIDDDAKIYAFLFRRINNGLSVTDAKYWVEKVLSEGKTLAKSGVNKELSIWTTKWNNKATVKVKEFDEKGNESEVNVVLTHLPFEQITIN